MMQLAMCCCTKTAREINFNFYILCGGFAVTHTPKRYLANKKDPDKEITTQTTANVQDTSSRDLASKILSKNVNFQRKFNNSDDSKEIAKQIVSDYPVPPTTCCMSGCANCVWVDYAEKLTEYYKDGGQKAITEINERVTDEMMKSFLLFELRMRKT